MLENPSNEVRKNASQDFLGNNYVEREQYDQIYAYSKSVKKGFLFITIGLYIIAFLPLILAIPSLGLTPSFTSMISFEQFLMKTMYISSSILFIVEFWGKGIEPWLIRYLISKKAKALNFIGKEWLKDYINKISSDLKLFNDKIDFLIATVVVNQLKPELSLGKSTTIMNIISGLLRGIAIGGAMIGVSFYVLRDMPLYYLLIILIPLVLSTFLDSQVNGKLKGKIINAIKETSKQN